MCGGKAIRVDNMHGHQVGHVKSEHALILGPLMDQWYFEQQRLVLQASIPSAGDEYAMPLEVKFYWVTPVVVERREHLSIIAATDAESVAEISKAMKELQRHPFDGNKVLGYYNTWEDYWRNQKQYF